MQFESMVMIFFTSSPDKMQRFLFLILLLGCVTSTRAQVPVVDVAALAEAVTTVAELRRQVGLLLEEIALSTEIKQDTRSHLQRYHQALSKRGIIPTRELHRYLRELKRAQQVEGAITWEDPEQFRRIFPMYQDPPDPIAAQRTAHEQTMATLQSILASLQVHSYSIDQAQEELKHMKSEIHLAKEPQQMRDVQANLQILHARELLLTRQALMGMMNIEVIRAADVISQKAQERMRYDAFVGNTKWLGDPTRYDVNHFLRMPGMP